MDKGRKSSSPSLMLTGSLVKHQSPNSQSGWHQIKVRGSILIQNANCMDLFPEEETGSEWVIFMLTTHDGCEWTEPVRI